MVQVQKLATLLLPNYHVRGLAKFSKDDYNANYNNCGEWSRKVKWRNQANAEHCILIIRISIYIFEKSCREDLKKFPKIVFTKRVSKAIGFDSTRQRMPKMVSFAPNMKHCRNRTQNCRLPNFPSYGSGRGERAYKNVLRNFLKHRENSKILSKP